MKADSLHILLADDNSDDRDIFGEVLNEMPVSVEFNSVPGGEELLNYLSVHEKELPDVVFLDLNMPKINGYECLKKIRNNEKLKDLPVVICTVSRDKKDVDKTFKGDANFFIEKSYKFSDFVTAVKRAVNLVAEKHFAKPQRENFVLS